MQRALSFDSTPSLAVPLRFLMTAPAFGLAAAFFLLWQGEAALVSRWSPATLALTHLITLGFLTMCMIGSLLQILPVVLGIEVPRSAMVSSTVHALLLAGTLALSGGFMTGAPLLFRLALAVLLAAFGLLLVFGLQDLWRARKATPVLAAIRHALIGLACTALLGALAASAFAWGLPVPLILLTDLHASWGLLGWVFMLTAGVAYQVVPMFQSTAPYPPALTRWLGAALLALLLLWGAARALDAPAGLQVALTLLAAAVPSGFALHTMRMIARRKRPQLEAPTRFWYLSLASLAASAVVGATASLLPAREASLLSGVLFIAGFGITVVNGMLYKIVPFLSWYHLQHRGMRAPNVRQFLPDARASLQFRIQLVAVALLAAATLWPAWLARPAALAFALSMLLLWINLWRALLLYRDTLRAGGLPRPGHAPEAT